jgi:hypothetical protein
LILLCIDLQKNCSVVCNAFIVNYDMLIFCLNMLDLYAVSNTSFISVMQIQQCLHMSYWSSTIITTIWS